MSDLEPGQISRRTFLKRAVAASGTLALAAAGIRAHQESKEQIQEPDGFILLQENSQNGVVLRSLDYRTKNKKDLYSIPVNPSIALNNAAVSPDAKKLVVEIIDTVSDTSKKLDIVDVQNGQTKQEILLTDQSLSDIQFSPDSKKLFLLSKQEQPDGSYKSKLDVRDLQDGHVLKTVDIPDQGIYVSINPKDENLILVTSANPDMKGSTTRVLDISQPEIQTISTMDATSGSWSPDGKSIAYQADLDKNGRPEIYIKDRNGHSQSRTLNFAAYPVWSPDSKSIAFLDDGVPDPMGIDQAVKKLPDSLRERIERKFNTDGNALVSIMNISSGEVTNIGDKWVENKPLAWLDVDKVIATEFTGGGNAVFDVSKGRRTPLSKTEVKDSEEILSWHPYTP